MNVSLMHWSIMMMYKSVLSDHLNVMMMLVYRVTGHCLTVMTMCYYHTSAWIPKDLVLGASLARLMMAYYLLSTWMCRTAWNDYVMVTTMPHSNCEWLKTMIQMHDAMLGMLVNSVKATLKILPVVMRLVMSNNGPVAVVMTSEEAYNPHVQTE